jgi:succinylglutamate desuccinylase
VTDATEPAALRSRRLLCDLTARAPGPTLLCIAGLHGNEPAGVRALETVAADLAARGGPARGRLVALLGNLAALERGERYVDRDLNRGWHPRGRRAASPARAVAAEEAEQATLRDALDEILDGSLDGVVALDLHTTSSHGEPFSVIGDTLANRAFAAHLDLPVVLGLEELLDGTLLDYLHGRVAVAVGVEGGQHEDPESVDRLQWVVRSALEALGMLTPANPPRASTREAGGGVPPGAGVADGSRAGAGDAPPRFLEVRHRQGVNPSVDGFRMRPGYLNFQKVAEGEIVASDDAGPIRVPERGLLLMPLYQKLGEDGFFVVRPIRPFWIRLSGVLRRLDADRWVRILPGVRPHPTRDATYTVNRRIALWYALEIFHLLGYRRTRAHGDVLLVTRR